MSKDSHRYIYCGCFIDPMVLYPLIRKTFPTGLPEQIKHPHVTLAWRPISFYEDLFGKAVEITVLAYGNNGRNEAIRVSLFSSDRKIRRMIQERSSSSTLHVTLSIANGAAPADSSALVFTKLDKPFTFTGIFGGYRADHTVDTGNVCISYGPAKDSSAAIHLEAIVNGKTSVSATSLTTLKRKASHFANQDNNPVDTMVVTFVNAAGTKQTIEFIRVNLISPNNTIRRGTWN